MKSFLEKVRSTPRLKKIALWALIPKNKYSPRIWVRLFLNPFFHKKGKGSVVRSRGRLDVFPFRKFVLGEDSLIEDFCVINNAVGDVIIGHNSVIGLSNIVIGPVNIGNNTILAQHVVISALNHNFLDITQSPKDQDVTTKLIEIGDDVWIGANCVLTSGVKIGKHSIIGAGSIVTKDIDDYCVAVGNPAVVIKKYDLNLKEWVKV